MDRTVWLKQWISSRTLPFPVQWFLQPIENVIVHYYDTMADNPPRVEAIFEPFTVPPGGGGPGGGCPFVLSRQESGDYVTENSILGRSELSTEETGDVWDTYPLSSARVDADGRILVMSYIGRVYGVRGNRVADFDMAPTEGRPIMWPMIRMMRNEGFDWPPRWDGEF